MKRLKAMILNSMRGITHAGIRFPMAVLGFLATATVILSLITTSWEQEFLPEKLMLTFLIGAVLGVTVQFVIERYRQTPKLRFFIYVIACLLIFGYFIMLNQELKISDSIIIRSFVLIFALLCIVLWIPSHSSQVDFNQISLVHVKAAVTSLLYSGVLSIGFASIIAAVDILLFDISTKSYSYVLTVIWIVFAPIYYLSLLPKFNEDDKEEQRKFKNMSLYPKFLEILISFIAIPLISAFTLVLLAYFLKILITFTWPSGQIGPMVLLYTIAGLAIYILASLLENKFARYYRKLFPIILLPIVLIQLISIGIRVNFYGITESRYYLLLFSIFAFLAGCMLMIKRLFHNGHVVLLAGILAIISVIPPVDAFTISRISQINRLEDILRREGLLNNGDITKKEVGQETKVEVTSILNYLDQNEALSQLSWLPKDFDFNNDMEEVFGFTSSFRNNSIRYHSVFLDSQLPLPIEGYDVLFSINTSRAKKERDRTVSRFSINGVTYQLKVSDLPDTRVAVEDENGIELIGTTLTEFSQNILNTKEEIKDTMTSEELSFEVTNNGYQLKIIFQTISFMLENEKVENIDCSMFVLFATP